MYTQLFPSAAFIGLLELVINMVMRYIYICCTIPLIFYTHRMCIISKLWPSHLDHSAIFFTIGYKNYNIQFQRKLIHKILFIIALYRRIVNIVTHIFYTADKISDCNFFFFYHNLFSFRCMRKITIHKWQHLHVL